MRRIAILAACGLALSAASCGGDKSVDATEPRPALASNQPGVATPTAAPAPQRAANNAPTADAVPANARWTIACTVIPGPGHIEKSRQAKEELIKSTKLPDWHVTHEATQSTLMYGYYRSYNDPKDPQETTRLRIDRERIARMQDQLGNRPFKEARPTPIDTPDPTAPPEYNLENAKGFYTLQIGAYQGPGRKEKAIEVVREARKMGVEAYYHHGPNVSEICVGAWPEQAMRKPDMLRRPREDQPEALQPKDQERPVLVIGEGAEVPDAVRRQYQKDLVERDTGKQVQVLEQKYEVVDPTLRAAMVQYPTLDVNGLAEFEQVRDQSTGQVVTRPKPSAVVLIPQSSSVFDAPTAAPALLNPTATPTRGQGGQLRTFTGK